MRLGGRFCGAAVGVMAVVGGASLIAAMAVIMPAADGGTGNIIPQIHQKRFEEVPELAARNMSAAEALGDAAKDEDHQDGDHRLDDHVLGNEEPVVLFVQVLGNPKRLGDKELA